VATQAQRAGRRFAAAPALYRPQLRLAAAAHVVEFGGRHAEPVSKTATAADQPRARLPTLRVAVLGGGGRPPSACPAALGGGRGTLTSSAAAAAAYESTTAAAADQPQDRVPFPGEAAVGGCRRLTSAGLMTLDDGRRP